MTANADKRTDAELREQALECCRQEEKPHGSATLFQTRLGLGYARARRIKEQLQDAGTLSKQTDSLGRCLLLPQEVRSDTPPLPFHIPHLDIPVLPPEDCGERSILVVPDIHSPHEDERAFQLMLSILDYFKWHEVLLLGDIANLDQVSRYDKDPALIGKLQQDLDHTTGLLRLIKLASPDAERAILFGNHEGRLRKFLWRNAGPLASLRSNAIESQLMLGNLGFRLFPEGGGYYITPNFVGTHGAKDDGCKTSSISAYSARANLAKFGIPGISGHTHRSGVHYVTDRTGTKKWLECGCLTAFKKAGYVTNPNWQLCLGELEVEGQEVHSQLHDITENYTCIIRGKKFRA